MSQLSHPNTARVFLYGQLDDTGTDGVGDRLEGGFGDDVILAERARQWAPAPDGGSAVWVRQTVESVDGEEKRVSNLWLSRFDGSAAVPLTRGSDTVAAPAISPDGTRYGAADRRRDGKALGY